MDRIEVCRSQVAAVSGECQEIVRPTLTTYVALGRNGETAGSEGVSGLVASAGWQREWKWRPMPPGAGTCAWEKTGESAQLEAEKRRRVASLEGREAPRAATVNARLLHDEVTRHKGQQAGLVEDGSQCSRGAAAVCARGSVTGGCHRTRASEL